MGGWVVGDRLKNVEVLLLEVSMKKSDREKKEPDKENPWMEFIGMFEGDAEFAEMMAQWRVERGQDEAQRPGAFRYGMKLH